jgi:hypothetical protein
VHDLGEVRCAIVTARVEGVPAADVAAALARAGVNVSTTVAGHSPLDTQDRAVHPLVRFSPHYYNTEEELGRAVSLVAAIAHRRPASAVSDNVRPVVTRSGGCGLARECRTRVVWWAGAPLPLPLS